MIGMFIDHPEHFYIDTGSGKHRKGFRLSEIILSTEIKLSLLGFHAFTGNDYVSSFYQKGKVICWRVLEKYPKFLQAFQDLGSNWELQDSTFESLNEYVSILYGSRKKMLTKSVMNFFRKNMRNRIKLLIFHCSHHANLCSCFMQKEQMLLLKS